MPAQVSPAIGRHRLGRNLRQVREARSLRLEDVATHLGIAPSTLSRIETGQAPTRTAYLNLMLDLYRIYDPDQRRQLADMAREGQRKDWWADVNDLLTPGERQYLGLETAASLVRTYARLTVPGLLQTGDYAAAAVRATRPDLTSDQARRRAAIQLRRQEQARSNGRRLHLIIDEAALRPIAPAHVMACEMQHLATMAADPLVTVQVAGLSTALPVLSLPFTLLSFADPSDPGMACSAGVGGRIVTTTHATQVCAMHAAFAALAQAAMSPVSSTDLIRELSQHVTDSRLLGG